MHRSLLSLTALGALLALTPLAAAPAKAGPLDTIERGVKNTFHAAERGTKKGYHWTERKVKDVVDDDDDDDRRHRKQKKSHK